MPRVVALYRYPVKGFTPEPCNSLTVLEEGRIAGDRALSFRFADSGLPETAWSRKQGHAVLMNTPGLARLELTLDRAAQRVRVTFDGEVLADDTLEAAGRKRIAAAVERYVHSLPENPLAGHPERIPLELIGDGVTPRYHDSENGQITLHSRESLAAVATALDAPDLSEIRFRSNIAIDGVAEWEEQAWLGRRLRIGDVEFDVPRSKVRCLATHANPQSGERDLQVMQTLVRAFGQAQPTFAIALTTRGRGGEIRVGDTVTLND
jgi:MOSC domain-containing protein